MSNSNKSLQWGDDVKIQRSRDGGISWIDVPRVRTFSLPDVSFDKRKITELGGPDKGWDTYVKGRKTLGSSEILCTYDRDGYREALVDSDSRESVQFRIILDNGDKLGFAALVLVSPEFDLEGEIVFKMKLDGSGRLWYTEGGA